MHPTCVLNTLVPFATRLADDGLVHVRAWRAAKGYIAVIAEMDWAMMVSDRALAYDGPGVFTYPGYALPAALVACHAAGAYDPEMIVRMPAPPGERFDRVNDPDDPQGWEPVRPEALAARLGTDQWPGPTPGLYVRPTVEEWIRTGVLP